MPRYARRPQAAAAQFSKRRRFFHEEADQEQWRRKDLSSCVLTGDPECQLEQGRAADLPIAYFCGIAEYCDLVGDKSALAQVNI